MAKASPPEALGSAELVTVVSDADIDRKLFDVPIGTQRYSRAAAVFVDAQKLILLVAFARAGPGARPPTFFCKSVIPHWLRPHFVQECDSKRVAQESSLAPARLVKRRKLILVDAAKLLLLGHVRGEEVTFTASRDAILAGWSFSQVFIPLSLIKKCDV